MAMSATGQIGNVDLVKQLNGALVYRLIDRQGPISRIQIAEISQLAPASITKITRHLLDRGLVKEIEQQASTGGRRAISIVTNNRHFHTVAVRLGRNGATLALYDLSGNLLAQQYDELPQRTQEALETGLISAIATFIDAFKPTIRELIAIGISLPGLVDPERGIVDYMPHIAVQQWALGTALRAQFGVPCFIGHDIRSFALAEHYFGATQDCDDSMLVRVHKGTGAGFILNRQIFLGKNRNVGEIGHIQVDPLGQRCYCGNFGCLETVASNRAIEQRVQHMINQGYRSRLTLDDCSVSAICNAANGGDELAITIIDYVGQQLGKVIAMAVNLFNPQKVVISGDITQAETTLLNAIQRCIDNQVLINFRENLPLVVSQLDHRSAIGAFALVKHAMLNGTLLQHLLGEIQA